MICVSEPQGASLSVSFHRIRPQIRRLVISRSTGWMICVLGLTLLMSATMAPAQDLDPRCSDRHATGKIVCKINKPIVNRPDVAYPSIVFAPRDTVYVTADGCVQTSNFGIGSGPTWKRYVNPSGANSDHQYHGLVRIPTGKLAGTDVGNSLTRIKNVVGRSIFVTGWLPTGVEIPASKLVLNLGYEDDDLSDNGYNDPDDGTEDQCKGDSRNDGGPAHVTVTICRGVPCGATTSRFDFDVLSSQMDPNGFLLNPHWSWQDRPGNFGKPADTSWCHEFSKHDLGRFWFKPNFPDCTDQAGLEDVDLPDGFTNEPACKANKIKDAFVKVWEGGGTSGTLDDFLTAGIGANIPGLGFENDSFIGHVNWFPITIEGRVAGTISHEKYSDDDYDFSLTCDDRIDPTCGKQGSLYLNGRSYLHVEFDSDETIDHFGTKAWVDLKTNVTESGSNPSAAPYFVGHTIVTGLFGLDGEHRLKSELHPLYAMATRLDANAGDPDDEVWLMFVRNRGDEGGCSSQIWDGGFQDYTFRLPWREGMTSVEVNLDKTEFEGTAGTSPPTVRVVAPGASSTTEVPSHSMARTRPNAANSGDLTSSAGIYIPETAVYVTFHLGNIVPIPGAGITWGPPASVPFIDGALHLKWTGPPGTAGHAGAGSPSHLGVLAATASPAEGRGSAGAGNTTGDDEGKDVLAAAVSRLPAPQQKSMQGARVVQGAPLVLHRLGPIGPVKILTAPPATTVIAASTRLHEPVAGPAGPATRKLAGDAAQMRALCAATNNAPYLLPPALCKANVRDHRTPPVPARDHRTPPI
jgi:hypothetical protein